MFNSEFLSQSLEEERRRKKEFSIYFKYLTEEQKLKMVYLGKIIDNLGFNDIKEVMNHLVKNGIKIDFF